MDRLGPVGLQGLDDLFPREQRLGLVAQPVDLLDLLVELDDLGGEQLVATVLVVDPGGNDHMAQADDCDAEDREPDRHRDELALPRLAPLLAVRKEIDANHQSKLRSANPQAMSRSRKDAASAICLKGSESCVSSRAASKRDAIM